MVWAPMVSAFVLKVATPDEIGLLPRKVAPSKNPTLSVGVPAPGATTLTVAVKTTVCPGIAGFGLAINVVVVFATFTTWDNGDEVLDWKLLSPPYDAVRGCELTLKALVL